MNKKLKLMLVGVVTLTLVGCSNTAQEHSNSSRRAKAEEVVSYEGLKNSKEIEVNQSLLSVVKGYSVDSDNGNSFTVTGEFLAIMGDNLEMKDEEGRVIAKDHQIKRFGVNINRMAEIEGMDGVVGYIGEETSDKFNLSVSKSMWYHFYDKDGKEIGKGNKNFSLSAGDWEIMDMDNKVVYKVHKNWSIGHSFTLTVIDDSKVPVESAVFYTIIMNEIIKDKD